MSLIYFKVEKLVRDNIPSRLDVKKIGYDMRVMETQEYVRQLKAKLIEEAHEVAQAQSEQELIEELADVLEVIQSLMHAQGVDAAPVEERRMNKRTTHGGFDKRLYCSTVYGHEDNPELQYYKDKPDQYLEIKKSL